jgi:hypothetical protein
MKYSLLKYLLLSCAFVFISILNGETHEELLSESLCFERASEVLEDNPNVIVIHINGMICGSCGVGVNFSLKKLDFVDRSRFTNGILLDAKNQFAVVAVKEGFQVNPEMIIKAAESAGYESTHYYSRENGVTYKVDL